MIHKIVEFCVKERLVVFLLLAVIVGYGWYSFQKVPLDAIPNVSENQVIVLTEWPGRSPKDIEHQITYPMSVALQSVAGAKSVRGKSMFGFSFVQVTFADNVDFYWARSRVSEQLATVTGQLPDGVRPVLAPDATPLGQIYYYVLDPPPGMDLADVRSKQDYVVKFALQSVDGVAEVASIGGYVRQYQIEVNPDELRFHKLTLEKVMMAVRDSNIDVGAKTVETGGMEYLVRGIGFIGADKTREETIAQIEQTVVATKGTVPVHIKDVASVQVGPAFRRGALDWNGSEAVGGVVVMRYGENPREVIKRVKDKINKLEKELNGIKIRGIYDRTQLVDETVATLTQALTQQILITVVVVVLFLLHFRSSIAIAVTLPMAVLMAFIAMNTFGVDANIMSLAGIAIAIGTMVDMAIIVSENIYRHLADWEKDGRPGGPASRMKIICDAAGEVVPAVITAVSTTVISFLPVFYLTGRDYRLFSPLAWTKTYSLIASLIVAITVVPMLSRIFLRSSRMKWMTSAIVSFGFGINLGLLTHFVWGESLSTYSPWSPLATTAMVTLAGILSSLWLTREKVRTIDSNPVSRVVNFFYEPTLRLLLRFKKTFLIFPTLIVFLGAGAWLGFPKILEPVEEFVKEKFGADFKKSQTYIDFRHLFTGLTQDDWISLDEGSWFYMPSLYPAASFSQALEVLQTQDTLIREIPEVKHVLGKIGRVESALDPAPAAMIETYIMLKPKDEWRDGMTEKKIFEEINELGTMPGVTMADELQPIKGRVVMLQSGIKAAMAIRIYGSTLEGLSEAANAIAEQLKKHPMVKQGSVSPDIVLGKPYFEFEVNRVASARYGMSVKQVNQVIETALGGKIATRTVEGRERYSVQVRYRRDLRENIDTLHKIPIVTNTGDVVRLEDLASLQTSFGPGVISSEDARLVVHVSFSPEENMGALETVKSVMKFLNDARTKAENGDSENGLVFPADDSFEFEPVGSFQNQIEANKRLKLIIPVVLLINIFIIYLQFREVPITLAIFTGIPVAFGGAMLALAYSGVELNTAVWVGFIALFGIAIDDGVVIATYLSQTMKKQKLTGIQEIRNATVNAGLMRIRPCLMTTATTVVALLPVIYASGRGADVARAMAIPVFGGMVVELITLFVLPVVYCGYMEFKWNGGLPDKRFERVDDESDNFPIQNS